MSKPKTERNKRIVELYDDSTKKLTFRALAAMFQLTEARVRQIYAQEKERT